MSDDKEASSSKSPDKFPWFKELDASFYVLLGVINWHFSPATALGANIGLFGYTLLAWLVLKQPLDLRTPTLFLFGTFVIRHDVDAPFELLSIPCWAFLITLLEWKWFSWFPPSPEDETSSP